MYNLDPEIVVQAEDLNPPEQPEVPNAETEFVTAKMWLQKCSPVTGDNMYDHLSEVLNKILAERPENVVDFFEEYSRKIKEQRFRPLADHLEDIYVPPGRYILSKKYMNLLRLPKPESALAMNAVDLELSDMAHNNMLQLCYFFEQAGIGFDREEMFCLNLSMRQLIKYEPIASIRFWGKIYGLYKNYIVVECQLKEEEYMRRNEIRAEEQAMLEAKEAEAAAARDQEPDMDLGLVSTKEDEGDGEGKDTRVPRPLPLVPPNLYEEPPEAPSEPYGVGVNKKVYFVCNEVGDPWVELPEATPQQIRVARQIKKSFTGLLEQDMLTYPAFPGNESNYLRAQIARISAGTQISPLGYYTFKEEMGEEEEEAEEEEAGGGQKTEYKENSKFVPVPLNDMLDPTMSFWVHNTVYILPQGRTSWWNPYPLEGMDEELGEEEGGGKPTGGLEPETGPPVLTPLSEDATLEAIPAWSTRASSFVLPEYAVAIVRSNLWPGAYCFANQGKIWHNVYLGYGHKHMAHNFSPTPLPPIEQDYPLGPEIMEMTDPTGAEEEQWRIDHLPKILVLGEGEEVPEEAEEEEEQED